MVADVQALCGLIFSTFFCKATAGHTSYCTGIAGQKVGKARLQEAHASPMMDSLAIVLPLNNFVSVHPVPKGIAANDVCTCSISPQLLFYRVQQISLPHKLVE